MEAQIHFCLYYYSSYIASMPFAAHIMRANTIVLVLLLYVLVQPPLSRLPFQQLLAIVAVRWRWSVHSPLKIFCATFPSLMIS